MVSCEVFYSSSWLGHFVAACNSESGKNHSLQVLGIKMCLE